MSRYIAPRVVRGAKALVMEAEIMLERALAEKGPKQPILCPSTGYCLPTILGITGKIVERTGDLQDVMEHARRLLHSSAATKDQTGSLGQTASAGLAALLAAEAIEALRGPGRFQPEGFAGAELPSLTSSTLPHGPIDDLHARSWGIQLVDGRMPGFAVIAGCAKSNEVAVKLVRDLQDRNIPCLLAGNGTKRSIVQQLQEEGVEFGYETHTLELGIDPYSSVHALGFATRCALMLRGLKPGMSAEIMKFNQERTRGFMLALGEMDDILCALAAGASNFGLPLINASAAPEDRNGGAPDANFVSVLFDSIDGAEDQAKASGLVQKCIEVRGLKVKLSGVVIPVRYGYAFEGETVADADLCVEYGGQQSQAFEFLQMADLGEVTDGKIEVIGPDVSSANPGTGLVIGIVIDVAGHRMQRDFEPVLERRIHDFLGCASGIQHSGARDKVRIRVSNTAAAKGFRLESLGRILHTRYHEEFDNILEKLQIRIITDLPAHANWLAKARTAYAFRDQQNLAITDDKVEEFYSCNLCDSFAPDHVCIVSPDRISPCGAHNWLECRAAYMINSDGPHQPIRLGRQIDAKKGTWEGLDDYVSLRSHGAVRELSMYSIMQSPMCACGGFQSVVVLIPEANGVMIVSQEDDSMTPAGLTFSSLASIAADGQQTPGVLGVGKSYLISPKFILAEGGFKRVVWMSSILKQSMADEFKAVCLREGDPDLLDKIADERNVTSVDQLLAWLKGHHHPAMAMEPMF